MFSPLQPHQPDEVSMTTGGRNIEHAFEGDAGKSEHDEKQAVALGDGDEDGESLRWMFENKSVLFLTLLYADIASLWSPKVCSMSEIAPNPINEE
jgi:hypothetical protein